MILIKYKPSDFKKYCPDSKTNTYEKYQNNFDRIKYLLQYNHQVIEVIFDKKSYLNWCQSVGVENSYLSQQGWAGEANQGRNAKKNKFCIVCTNSFLGRIDSKFCSSICRSKNYREEQKVKRKDDRISEAICFLKFIGIDSPNEKMINTINTKLKWQREELLSRNPKNKNYKKHLSVCKKLGITIDLDEIKSREKTIFEQLR